MVRSKDQGFINLQDKARFGNELKDLLKNKAFNILLEGMIQKRHQLIDASDSFEMNVEEAEKMRMMRASIKTFISSIIFSIEDGLRAEQKIKEVLDFETENEKKIRGKGQ